MKYLRQDYVAQPPRCTHDQYYGQFVNEGVRALVLQFIGAARIRESKEPLFNDIPLHLWDRMFPMLHTSCSRKVHDAGDAWSLATAVCIAKAAAQQIKLRQEQRLA